MTKIKSKFTIQVNYKTQSGDNRSRFFHDIEAVSVASAKGYARNKFDGDYRHRNSRITEVIHRDGEVPIKNETIVTITASGCITPKDVKRITGQTRPEFYVGREIEIKRDQKGPAIIRANFTDRKGNTRLTLEYVGYVPNGGKYFVNVTPEQLRIGMTPQETVSYKVIYPTGEVYDSDRPYQNSTYGVDQLVQVKITKSNGRIIRKEIV